VSDKNPLPPGGGFFVGADQIPTPQDRMGMINQQGGQDTPQENEVTRDLLYSMQEPRLRIFYRNLPHWELDGATYFITRKTFINSRRLSCFLGNLRII
jgi:hypothetical protein